MQVDTTQERLNTRNNVVIRVFCGVSLWQQIVQAWDDRRKLHWHFFRSSYVFVSVMQAKTITTTVATTKNDNETDTHRHHTIRIKCFEVVSNKWHTCATYCCNRLTVSFARKFSSSMSIPNSNTTCSEAFNADTLCSTSVPLLSPTPDARIPPVEELP